MEKSIQIHRERFDAPSIATVIFAPQHRNYNSITVTCGQCIYEPTQHSMVIQEPELLGKRISEAITQSIKDGIVIVSGPALMERDTSLFAINMISAAVSIGIFKDHRVPARSFPFVRHVDLLSSPIEGLIFDTDENS